MQCPRALEDRREYPIPNDLLLYPSGHHNKQRSVSLEADDIEASIGDLASEFGVPTEIRPWLETTPNKRERMIETVNALDEEGPFKTVGKVAEHLSFAESTLRNYWSWDDNLAPCHEKNGKWYKITPVGKQAAPIDWDRLNENLEELE